MARPGQIVGKTKATLYLDEEVHRALRIRAAETGESMGDIAERALRKELGMLAEQAEVTINVVEVGEPGEAYMERVESFPSALTGADEEIVEQAIREVEKRGYTVVRNDRGGCCEVTRYSDGTVAVGVTVERR